MNSLLVGIYLLIAEIVYIVVLFLLSYFFVKFFWNREKIRNKRTGKMMEVEKIKPDKRKVMMILGGIWVIILITDILCVKYNINLVAAARVYPFGLEEHNVEGLYPRFLYNMQICGEGEQEIKLNILSFFDTEELQKTIARDEMKKNQGTYFDNLEENKNDTTYVTDDKYDEKVENVIENKIDEDVDLKNEVKNESKNEVKNNVKNEIKNETKKEDTITTTTADGKKTKK